MQTTFYGGMNGYIYTDDGTPIEVFQSNHLSYTQTYTRADNGTWNPDADPSPAQDDASYDTDCHGLTFADGKFFIDNSQIKTLLAHDNYSQTDETHPPQVGDVAIFLDAGDNVIHSATVTEVNKSGQVTKVAGLGGLEMQSKETSPAEQFSGAASIQYWHKDKPKEKPSETKKRVSFVKEFFKKIVKAQTHG